MAGASAAPEEVEHVISIEVNGQTFSATLADNDTARAFAARLPMTKSTSIWTNRSPRRRSASARFAPAT